MGPGTVAAIQALLARLREAGGVLVSGTDANAAGDRYAERHAALAAESGVAFERARPAEDRDWNDVLVQILWGDRRRHRKVRFAKTNQPTETVDVELSVNCACRQGGGCHAFCRV
jgi:Toprim-like